MSYNFSNDIPIYLQIVDLITNDITSGVLKCGEKIPSVRDYAIKLKANPNTVCKALLILENNKLITTERTNGKFVTTNLDIINKYKYDLYKEKVNSFIKDLESMGYTKEDIIKTIKEG